MGILSLIKSPQTAIIKVLAIIGVVSLIAIGSYYYGYRTAHKECQNVITKYELDASKKSDELHTIQLHIVDKLVPEYITKIQKIEKVKKVNVYVAENYVPDHEYLSDGWLYVHNAAVEGTEAVTSSAANATPSSVTAGQALAVVTENYAICKENAQQLIGLQNYIKAYNAAVDKVNKNK